MIHLHEMYQIGKPRETESRPVVARGWEEVETGGESLLMVTGLLWGLMKMHGSNILEMVAPLVRTPKPTELYI